MKWCALVQRLQWMMGLFVCPVVGLGFLYIGELIDVDTAVIQQHT